MRKKVAVIGTAFRLPGSTREEYWSNLLLGKNLVTEVEESRWAKEPFLHPDKGHPGTTYTFAAGSIGDVSLFDAGFFGISPREAAVMDPQQRIMLELAWETFEHAGIPPATLRGTSCGVYLGVSSVDYSYRSVDDLTVLNSSSGTGNTGSIVANRLSYAFDLHGPSMAIDTACSSSLVAFHQACLAVSGGDVETALAGGISLHLHPYGFLVFSKASMLSRKGRCSPFDEAADGYVRSEGAGLFLLKDYEQAIRDGNHILAVVAGSSVNTDGRKTGLTVPSEAAQIELMSAAYASAGLVADDLDYLEAHGTGTPVGDPIESRAIGRALGQHRTKGPLPIGSVKSNMGHLETASGVAGLVKALYSIVHRQVPATIGISRLNPAIPFDELNLAVVRDTLPLKPSGLLTVGVNSFGFGGANAHVILQSHEVQATAEQPVASSVRMPLVVSAKDENALREYAIELGRRLESSDLSLYDACYHALYRREQHAHGAAMFCDDLSQATDLLARFAKETDGRALSELGVESGVRLKNASQPVFVYSGNGCQWQGMGLGLLSDDDFRRAVAEIDAAFQPLAGYSILDDLEERLSDVRGYALTELAQPALFALQVGVTRMLAARGVKPAAVFGHSVGEVAAAWASGALDLQSATEVIYHRSRLQGMTAGAGQMTAIGVPAAEAQRLIEECHLCESVWVAGENSFKAATLAGKPDGLAILEAALADRQLFARRLDLDYAFHCPAMDSIESELIAVLGHLRPTQTRIPMFSTVTGQSISGEALDADYWWRNIRMPVLFQQAAEAVIEKGLNVFLEIGGHPILRSYLADALAGCEVEGRVVPTIRRNESSNKRIDGAVGQLLLSGSTIDLSRFFPAEGRFVELPYYAWQRERYWCDSSPEAGGSLNRYRTHPLLGHMLGDGALAWNNVIDTQTHPSLADHQVGEAVLFPGAGFAELAIASALHYQPGDHVDIEELEIRSPLLLASSPAKKVQVSLNELDGLLSVRSRTYGVDEAWTSHVVAKIRREAKGAGLPNAPLELPRRNADFDAQQHLELTRAVGLHYGPAYQAVECGWISDGHVIAKLRAPDTIADEIGTHHLHPALLDSAFQLITALLANDPGASGEGLAFVPVRMDRIVFAALGGTPQWVSIHLRRRSAHSLLADFHLYDENAKAVATVLGVRFKGVKLQRADKRAPDLVGYVSLPRPVCSDSALSSASSLHDLLIERLIAPTDEQKRLRYADEVEPLLDSLCAGYFQNVVASKGGHLTESDVAGWRCNVAPAFCDWLIGTAESDGLLAYEAGAWSLVGEVLPVQAIWQELFRTYPEYFQVIHSVGRIGMQLGDLLEGRAQFDDVLPRESQCSQLAQFAAGQQVAASVRTALKAYMIGAIEDLPAGKRLRVLELCLGEEPFVAHVATQLDFDRCDYHLSMGGQDSELHTTDLPHIRRSDLAALASEASGHKFDLIILRTEFAPLEDLRMALTCAARAALEGALLVVMTSHPTRWADFVYGAGDQWWLGSRGTRPSSRQYPVDTLKDELDTAGFKVEAQVETLPGRNAGGYLILGSGRNATLASIVNRSWVLVHSAAEADITEAVAQALRDRGQNVLKAESESMGSAQFDSGRPHSFVLLSGLYANTVDQAADRCVQAGALAALADRLHEVSDFWIPAIGATCGQLLPEAQTGDVTELTGSIVWGFGRTLANEASDVTVRLIDLHSEINVNAFADALVNSDQEIEMAIASDGGRYVPRLRSTTLKSASDAYNDGDQIALGFEFPGQLRNLRWENRGPLSLINDELEVSVSATGLNFRDVMYALGLLSDEAIENGFSGPTLGFEFAGVVERVGEAVEGGFVPGDRVVGFGPSSFSNRLATKATAVALIPAHLSFEAAATIPSTFFTVYYALHHLARLEEGEKVLIHGAAGGVGIAAIQIAQWLGAEIYATAGSDEKRDFLRMMGVEHIFDSRSLAYADQILELTQNKGVDVVLNSLAGDAIHRNLCVLKPFGRFLELGKRDFYENTKIGLRPFRNNISYFGIDADQLMSERPALTRRLFAEMMALFEDGTLSPLPYKTFDSNNIVDAFRYMQQARQIGKIVVTYETPIQAVHSAMKQLAADARLGLDPEGCYVITGGLSGFGLRTAQWLVERGARHLVLLGRRGPATEEAQPLLADWRAQGLKVQAEACDITDRVQLSAVFAMIERSGAVVKGVVHAATVFRDGLVRNMDREQLQDVLEPKVTGAALLHELTESLPLDFFVLFSSATTLFGNPGQANYVAANTWLEALARYRISRNLPATCVLWGAIDDAGFLARNEHIKEALQSRMGGDALPASVALGVLEQMLLERRSGLGVLELDWTPLSRFLPTAGSPKFEELAKSHSGDTSDEESGSDARTYLKSLPPEELYAAVCEMLKEEVAEILRIAPSKLEVDKPLQDMGLDSLMGVETVVALEARFGIRLPVMALSENPSIGKLASRLIDQLDEASDDSEAARADAEGAIALHAAELDEQARDALSSGLMQGAKQSIRLIQ